ncbi:MAG: nicotinate phosphoribosyltransferase [Nanoarchaeota archaeon]|nr:nicotinate phosphoribosyltransferase [Nanoarchaeota archaeon]
MKYDLPEKHEKYTDKYFLRSREVLEKDGVNPWVKMQVFVRKGPGKIRGIEEAIQILEKYSKLKENRGKVYALPEGSDYEPCEAVMTIEGNLQDFIELETMYLGVITSKTTGGDIDLEQVEKNAREVVEAAEGRPVLYFGARHWHYSLDAKIAEAAYKGGCVAASTDIGAETFGQEGVGTIPHALALAYGGTVKAAKAFDKHIDKDIDRLILIDTFNRELTDAVETAKALGKNFSGVRIDTCKENIGEGGTPDNGNTYETGNGVTIELAYNMRKALDSAGFPDAKIVLSSGFGKVDKVKAFVEAEKKLGVKLFDAIGAGGLFNAHYATADIVEKDGKPFSKKGRKLNPNPRLEEVLLK